MPKRSESIDALCARYIHPNGPGLALAVLHEGAVLYRRTFGLANLEHEVPITRQTVFETASVSKQVTAFALHLLVQEGRLTLDDDVRDHVPAMPDFGAPITLRHCLHHTSGLRDWVEALGFAGRKIQDVNESEHVMRWLGRQRGLNHAPGAEHSYTNTGYFVLAEVVAAVSGMSFAQFCRDRIFDPLGMTNTHFRDALEAVIKNRADSYYRNEDGTFAAFINSQAIPGATSMQTTLDDMVRWLGNFETGSLGGRDLLEAMHQPGVLRSGEKIDYGSGLELTTYRGRDVAWHTGGWACFGSLLFRMPEKRLAIAVLSNTEALYLHDFWPPLVDLCLGESPPPHGAAGPEIKTGALAAQPAELVGIYMGPGGPVNEISLQEGTLRIGAIGGASVALVPLGGLRVQPEGQTDVIEFFRDETGRISHYTAWMGQHQTARRTRIEPQPNTGSLADYVGTFYSQELEVGSRISVLDGVLTASSINHGDEPFMQIGRDLFVATDSGPLAEILEFCRAEDGMVDAVFWSSLDARHQRFDRILR